MKISIFMEVLGPHLFTPDFWCFLWFWVQNCLIPEYEETLSLYGVKVFGNILRW